MLIIGCDFHPKFQQIAYVDRETGEYGERRLSHPEEATRFYRSVAEKKVRIGLEATGNFRWFRRLLEELGLRCCSAMQPRFTLRFRAGSRLTSAMPGTF